MYIHDLIISDTETIPFDDIQLTADNKSQIQQLIKEHKYTEALLEYGLPVNNKVLLKGHSGCGKTTTAKAIAKAMDKPIVILNLSTVVNSRIGETSLNIKQVFDKAGRDKAVLFLDEFDQIGKARSTDEQDVGEMRRIVNTIIQLIDYFPKQALLICATNHPEIIDTAILRRFQLKITFDLPETSMLDPYYDQLLHKFPPELQSIERKYGISYAEAKDYTFTTVKTMLIAQLEAATNTKNNG